MGDLASAEIISTRPSKLNSDEPTQYVDGGSYSNHWNYSCMNVEVNQRWVCSVHTWVTTAGIISVERRNLPSTYMVDYLEIAICEPNEARLCRFCGIMK